MAYFNAARLAVLRDLLFPAQLRRAFADVLGAEFAIAGANYGLSRAPTAGEVSGGTITISPGFTPLSAVVQFRVTATGVLVAWDGSLSISGATVVIDNAGSVDWAETDTMYLVVQG